MRAPQRPGSWRTGGIDVGRHFVATHDQRRGRSRVRHLHHLRLLGLGRRTLLAVVGDRPADRAGHRLARTSARCSPVPTRWTGTFAETPLERNLPVLLALLDVWYRNFHGFSSRSIAPYHQGVAALAGIPAAARDGEQRQACRPRWTGAAVCDQPGASGASREPTASTPISRCCTRAPTWCRSSSSPCADRCTRWPSSIACCWPIASRRRRP